MWPQGFYGVPLPDSLPLTVQPADVGAREALRAAVQHATLGEYEVYGELGRGGMATVYLAHEIALDRLVALKVLDPSLTLDSGMVERFKREARTAAHLVHPHIIPIYAVRQTDRLVYFIMRYVEGRSLDSVIDEVGPLPVDMVQTILQQVGGALAHAHRKGVVHRDIKPANIMIDTDGWAVVTDFGIAKVLEATGLTSTGAAVGTPYYMSPEQYSSAEVTGRADQYSLGVVAWEMLTGKPPFVAPTVLELMRAHCLDDVPPVETLRADCPPILAATVARMLAKKPADRYESVEQALATLPVGALAADHPVRIRMITLAKSGPSRQVIPPPPTSPVPLSRIAAGGGAESAPSTPLSRKWLIAGGLSTALAFAVGVAMWGGGGAPPVAPPLPELSQVGDSLAGQMAAETDNAKDSLAAATGSLGLQSVPAARALPPAAPTVPRPQPPPPPAQPRTSAAPDSVRAESLAVAPPPPSSEARVLLGTSHESGAFVYINGEIQRFPNPELRWWTVPAGRIQLSVAAAGCTAWDTVWTIPAGASVSIGKRFPVCPPK